MWLRMFTFHWNTLWFRLWRWTCDSSQEPDLFNMYSDSFTFRDRVIQFVVYFPVILLTHTVNTSTVKTATVKTPTVNTLTVNTPTVKTHSANQNCRVSYCRLEHVTPPPPNYCSYTVYRYIPVSWNNFLHIPHIIHYRNLTEANMLVFIKTGCVSFRAFIEPVMYRLSVNAVKEVPFSREYKSQEIFLRKINLTAARASSSR